MRLAVRAEFPARSLRAIAAAVAFAALVGAVRPSLASAAASESPPYPPSAVAGGVTWDFPGMVRLATGSDLWPITWAGDDHLYTAWGDGGGFGGNDIDGRVTLGVARLEGPVASFTAVNVFGGVNPLAPATFDGKPTGLLSVGDTLYMGVMEQDSWIRAKIGRSTDGGLTWAFNSPTEWDFDEPDGAFSDPTFLNYGRDYAGARDGYVYVYSADDRARDYDGLTLTDISMFRAPVGRIMDRSSYEYFAGMSESGQPTWTADIAQRVPVFVDPNGVGWGARVSFVPGLARYLLTAWHSPSGGWGIFDAPEPWGPWTTVAYYEEWIDSAFKFGFGFNQKWMDADGRSLHMVFSGTGAYDSFNLIPVRFDLATGVSTEEAPLGPSLRVWPKPFHGGVLNVEARLTAAGSGRTRGIEVLIHDVAGRRVRTLARGTRGARTVALTWDGRDDRGAQLASGVYFMSVSGDERPRAAKVVLLR